MKGNSDIVNWLSDYLSVDEIEDDAVNGVQVDASGTVQSVGFAVDAGMDTIQKAIEKGVDLMVVHHGIMWGLLGPLTGRNYGLVSGLIKNDIALYSAHLPLDIHPEIGNNVLLAEMLDAETVDTFMDYKGEEVALMCRFHEKKKVEDVAKTLSASLDTEPDFFGGHRDVEKVALMTGKGGSAAEKAFDLGAELFITGERTYMAYNVAVDMNRAMIFAGHHNTETLGIKRLMEKVKKKFNVDCHYISRKTII